MTKKYSVDEVSKIYVQKALQNRESYKDVLEKVFDKVLFSAQRGLTEATYFIRPLQPDRPILNTHNAFNYVRDKLERNGFTVNHVMSGGTVMVHVSWKVDKNIILERLASGCVTKNPNTF